MADDVEALVARGREALGQADWEAARAAFSAALDNGADVSARLGLADAMWWLGDAPGIIEQFEVAYGEARASGQAANAAWAALHLALCQDSLFGNQPATAGWCARAQRLIEEHDLEALRGLGSLVESLAREDMAEAEHYAREAVERGRRTGDTDLELCALAQLGEIRIRQGRVRDGMALLDEAMAGATGGESAGLTTVMYACCCMIRACRDCAEFDRAGQWLRSSDRFCQRYGCAFLYVGCRTTYGALLFFTGDWEGAERELRAAMTECAEVAPVYYGDALASLADLRLAQGRDGDAARLLNELEGDDRTAVARARLALLRGETDAAAHTARHWRGSLSGKPLQSARLQEVLGEAELLRGDREAALATGHALVERGKAGGAVMTAYGLRLVGHATADIADSRESLESALAAFRRLGMPYEAARSSLGLARTLQASEPRMALMEARAAESTFRALGAQRDADAATGLRRALGDAGSTPGPRVDGELTRREQQVMALLGEGLSNPVIAERLCISRRTVEHHVSRILGKLGLVSRAEVAAEAVRRAMDDTLRNP